MAIPKNPEAGEGLLTEAQSAALPLIAAGAKKKDAAAAAGVCPQTISEWLHEPHFSAVLQAQREKLAGVAVERLRDAMVTAVETVVGLMESGSESIRLKAATYFLDRVLLLTAGEHVLSSPPERTDTRSLLATLGVNQ